MNKSFYRAFEDRYRGSREVIRERLQAYLPFIGPLSAAGGSAAIDLGCGRGEWLELLIGVGFDAVGVDLDEGMLAACRERKLPVINGDALTALRERADASVALVSAFHLVEHIPFEQTEQLIAQALRVLQPGGLLILETPNPENLVVGTSSFYDDPSHMRPLPPKLLAFLVEFGGFARHHVLRLQHEARLEGDVAVDLFDVLAGVSPDYCVVAQKAGPAHLLAPFDGVFARRFGLDLHTLAQRYRQTLDAARSELSEVIDRHTATLQEVQQQLLTADSQISHIHAKSVTLSLDLAALSSQQAALQEARQAHDSEVGEQLARAHAAGLALTDNLGKVEANSAALIDDKFGKIEAASVALIDDKFGKIEAASVALIDDKFGKIEAASVALIDDKLGEIEAANAVFSDAFASKLKRLESTTGKLMAPSNSAQSEQRLHARVESVEAEQRNAGAESARLAAHVAWLEGRLIDAENTTVALGQQLALLQQRHTGFGFARRFGPARLVRGSWRRLTRLPRLGGLRPAAVTVVRRLIQTVLRRPALKRIARRAVGRFPGLHSRLLQLMYAPAAPDASAEADADPLALSMSPRSLSIYHALIAKAPSKD